MSSAAIWDAGIIVPGIVTSLVFPLDDPTIETAEDIVAIISSCDCTTAEALNYWSDNGRRRVAIRVDMLEQPSPTRRLSAARLAVLLKIKTRSGDVIERSVRVLLSADVAFLSSQGAVFAFESLLVNSLATLLSSNSGKFTSTST